jgi:hypothetical protein
MDPTKEKALLGPPTVEQTELRYQYIMRYRTAAGRVCGFQNLPGHGAINIKAFNLKDIKEDIQIATTAPASITLAGKQPQSDSPYRPRSDSHLDEHVSSEPSPLATFPIPKMKPPSFVDPSTGQDGVKANRCKSPSIECRLPGLD